MEGVNSEWWNASVSLIQATCSGVADELAGVLTGELVPQLERSRARHTVAIDSGTGVSVLACPCAGFATD
jgi:hypothetical protein